MRKNGINHIRCAPSSNGAVERFVQIIKQAMKAGEKDGRTLEYRLSSSLLSYRSTPNATTNILYAHDPILESKFENSHGFG